MPNNYITFSSSSSFTLRTNNRTKYWNGTLQYSTNTTTWTTWSGTTTLSSANNVLYLRGIGNTIITGNNYTNASWVLYGTNKISCIGNIENLLDYQTVLLGNHPTMGNHCYYYMFYNCTLLSTAPSLPATTLAEECYSSMFGNCTSLTTTPSLPATTLAEYCYYYMFYNCTSLTTITSLPATTLANNCYTGMFGSCTSLTTTPSLPATTLAPYCYNDMFYNCTSLTTITSLPATTLASSCYSSMFRKCTSLTTITSLPATTLASYCYSSMFRDCTSLKVSATQTGNYQYAWRLPTSGTGSTATDWNIYMLTSSGGTFTSEPTINTTYYVENHPIPEPTTIDVVETLTNCSTDSSNPLEIEPSSTGNIFFYHAQPQYAFGTPSVSGGTITDSSITSNANGTTELMLEISVNADATSLGINVSASLIPTTYSLTNCTSDSNNPTSVSHQATGYLFTFHTTSAYAFTSYNVQNADITQHDITTYQDGSSDLTLVISVNGLATSVDFTIVATPYVNVTLNVIGGGITASPNNPTRVVANSTNNVFGFTLGYGRNLLDYGVVNGSGVWVIDNNAISLTLTSTSVNNITINITTSVKMAVVDANRTQCTSTTTFPTSIDILSTHRFSFTPTQGYTLTTLEVTTQNVVWQRVGNDIIINTFNESVTAITISAIATISNATIHLYKNSAENIRVDKTAYLEPIGVIYGTFRETTGIIAPSILIQYSGLINFNYVYIADFNRYYYVSAVKSVNTNLWELELMVDVLYTYKDKILNLKAFVDRNENAYDPYITDEKLVVKEGVSVSEITLENKFLCYEGTYNSGNFLLTGLGVKAEEGVQ